MKTFMIVFGLCLLLGSWLYAGTPQGMSSQGMNANQIGELRGQILEMKAQGIYDAQLWNQYFELNGQTPAGRRGGNLDQGGEDCATAVIIGSLPYSDAGSTIGTNNDYLGVCYPDGSGDVVYSYTPAANQAVDISLCGSSYDTDLMVYANACNPGTEIACNDDACDFVSSFIGTLPLIGGTTYYIVVDGFGGSVGDYVLNVTEAGSPPPLSGRCCYDLGDQCGVMTDLECAALGGIFAAGQTCDIPCDPLPPSCTCGPMDLVFVVDVTGSMGGAIANVVAELPTIISTANYYSCDLQLGLVTFRDQVNVLSGLTTDQALIQLLISSLTASGGDGTPEASDEALLEVVSGTSSCAASDWTTAFRPTAAKVVVLITDAPPAGCDDNYTPGVDDVQAHNVALAAQAAGILISAVYVPTFGIDPTIQMVMQDYATTTAGSYFETAANGIGTGAAITTIVENCGTGECVPECELVEDPCVIPVGCYRTQTQGGWGQDRCRGGNVACLRDEWFDDVYPGGLVVGGINTLTLTNSAAVAALLPTGGTPGSLAMSYMNPPTTSAGVFAGQVVSLAISVGFGDWGVPGFGDLGSLVYYYGPFTGWTVDQILALANAVLGGDLSGLPAGVTLSGLNGVVTSINENFTDGSVSTGYLVDPCCVIEETRGTNSANPQPGETVETVETEAASVVSVSNHPNPFNPATRISYNLVEAGFATLKVFNVMGQEVATLVNGNQTAGLHAVTFDASGLPTGVYVYRLTANGQTLQGKMLLMK